MSWETTFQLQRYFFTEAEKLLAKFGDLSAYAFIFSTGVQAVRLENPLGEVTILPYQGQQIWDAQFNQRTLTMKSMFKEPRLTTEYLNTYGAFLIHCGATTMGVPTREDTHPLHGELPNASYQSAQLVIGEDDQGYYMAVTGSYQHTVAFNHNYAAHPIVKLYGNSSRFWVSMTIQNLKHSEMELMYLTHVNFRPVDDGRLVYSAHSTPEHVRVRSSIPSHIHPAPEYRDFLNELQEHPDRHNLLQPGLKFDPEVVFYIDYLVDEEGWAHSMQIHPDGSADYIRHHPAQLRKGVRWISRTADQDALGLVLPATAESEGYLAEKAKGNLLILPPEGEFHCELEIGYLSTEETVSIERAISRILLSD